MAIVSAGSYYICSKSAPSQHHKKSEDEKKKNSDVDDDTSETRTDLEEIHQEQKSIKYQIQCAVVFSATFLSTAYASFSIPSNLIGKIFNYPHHNFLKPILKKFLDLF